MEDERYRVQSLGRAMDIVERIAESGPAGARLTEFSGQGLSAFSKAAAYVNVGDAPGARPGDR